MQSTEPRRRDQQRTEHSRQWLTVGRRILKRTALLWWIAVGSYAVARPLLVPTYTVWMVGSVGCLALIAVLLDPAGSQQSTKNDSQQSTKNDSQQSTKNDSQQSTKGGSWQFGLSPRSVWRASMGQRGVSQGSVDRARVGGLAFAVLAGTVGIAGSVDNLAVTQPSLTTGGLLAGVLLSVGLVVAVARVSRVVAAIATVGIVISWASVPDLPVVEILVFDGIYGPLTQATVVWIAPLCLLVGLWQAAGVGTWLSNGGKTVTTSQWSTTVDPQQTGYRLAVGSIAAVVLIGWQTAGSVRTIGVATLPLGLVGAVFLGAISRLRRPTDSPQKWRPDEWLGPLAMAGGPLVAMATLGVGYRLPFGMVVVAGCLCCIGCCLVGPLVGRIAPGHIRVDRSVSDRIDPSRASTAVRVGRAVVFDGSVVGVRLLARIVMVVAVVSGSVAVMEAAGLLIPLLTAIVWLSGGQWLAVAVVVAGGCVALGLTMPMIAGYAGGALIAVPMLQLLTPIAELSAHLLVVYAVGIGWLLAESQSTTEIMTGRTEQ